jgi:uncharacterized protein with HEPN domain
MRETRFYVEGMVRFAESVQSHSAGLDQFGFVADELIYDAILRNRPPIREAVSHVPDDVPTNHPEAPWRLIIATRNCLIHTYLGIDDDTLWSIIQDDVPALMSALKRLRQDEP